MRAGQLTSPQRLELVHVSEPTLQDGEVLVRLQRVSICGSDMLTFSRVLPEEEYPAVPGRPNHECAGVVEESRSEEFNPGRRVIVFPSNGNGLAEYLVEPPARLVPLPDDGALEHWVMCQHLGTVLYGISRLGDVIGKRVVVLGQGAIGLGFTNFLSRMNLQELIVTDLLDYRLDMSQRLGATHTINAQREDVYQVVRELTGGEGADIVVEAAGKMETARQAIFVAKLSGMVEYFGVPHEDVFPVDFRAFWDQQLTLISTSSGRVGAMYRYVTQTVHMIKQKRLDPSVLVTHRMKLEDMQQAYTMYEEKTDGIIKVVIDI